MPALDLLKKMLVAFPQARISAKKALQHPFFQNNIKEKKAFEMDEAPIEFPKHLQIALENLADYARLLNINEII